MYDDPLFFTPQQLADRWQVDYRTIHRRIKAGLIRHFRIGRNVRIPMDEVLRIESGESVQAAA